MQRAEVWAELVKPGRLIRRRLEAGEALFRQGDPTTAIYVVDSGRVRLVRWLEDGASVALHVAKAGETCAEAALWADVYHCDCIAEVPSAITAVPKPDLLAALEADPQSALSLTRALAVQVRDLRTQVELRNIRSAPERILAWLRLRAAGDPPGVTLDRPWTEIAAEIGLTHEAIYRALAALQRSGRIIRSGRRILLTAR
ncbi:MAG TPA: Crp/Fnr family transcriptional regulator [Azospirillum sp.]|nr:Crp/Fnr family transcriptional regulator [Azospirillum sp.]